LEEEEGEQEMKYTVVGFYHDNSQPFVDWVEGVFEPIDAANLAIGRRREHDPAVVEVLEGHHKGLLKNEEVLG
jgi:hypothetical protein